MRHENVWPFLLVVFLRWQKQGLLPGMWLKGGTREKIHCVKIQYCDVSDYEGKIMFSAKEISLFIRNEYIHSKFIHAAPMGVLFWLFVCMLQILS